MAYTRSFAQLSLAVQQLGGWENSDDITPAVLLQAINYGLLEGYALMVKSWRDYYTLDTTFAIVAGTANYPLATIAPNFYQLRHLDVSADGVRFKRCYPHDVESAHRYSGSPASTIFRVRYRMQGANLVLSPTPPVGTGKIYWIPLPVQFASVADASLVTFDVPSEEMLVAHLGQKFCLDRSELDTSAVERQIAKDTMGLRSDADSRDAGEPFYLDPNGPPNEDCEEWY
jgi:hypothetical protein